MNRAAWLTIQEEHGTNTDIRGMNTGLQDLLSEAIPHHPVSILLDPCSPPCAASRLLKPVLLRPLGVSL
jgi:hypothetical protein